MAFQPPPPPGKNPGRQAPGAGGRPPGPGAHLPPGQLRPAAPQAPSGLVYSGETVAVRRPAPQTAGRRPAPAAKTISLESLTWESISNDLRNRIERSPPLTASLALHVVVVLVLALWIVRQPPNDEPIIELAFSSFTETVMEEKGVQIEKTPEPVEEEKPEEVKTEKPPVEEPAAAPPKVEEAPAETVGAASSEAVAPAIGTLLDGREEGRREPLVRAFGGSDATEAAVAKALEWIVRQQEKGTGLWSLKGPYADGSQQENKVAATAMAVLALQGAGNTPRSGKHRAVLTRAWKALLAAQLPDGHFEAGPMPSRQGLYSHGQATVALCELYGMTQEKKYFEPAQRAVAYAVAAQGPAGGWRYDPGKDGDMSVTGWYMMALKSAEMAYLTVPPATMEGLARFVDRVAVEEGARYGYRAENPENPAFPVTDAVSAEGLLCRQYLGWKRDDERLVAGAELLLSGSPIDFGGQPNAYAWYYITQVVHNLGGSTWDRWNERMRQAVPAAQVKQGRENGSWDPTKDRWGGFGGRLYMTCFCTYMLEVYYRHLPLYEAVTLDDAASRP